MNHITWRSLVLLIGLNGIGSLDARPVITEAAVDEASGLGVGKIVIPLNANADFQSWHAEAPWLTGDRVFYPVTQPSRLLDQVGAKLTGQPATGPREAVIHFLFRGPTAFDVGLHNRPAAISIQPEAKPARYKRLLKAWWRDQQQWLQRDWNNQQSFPPYLRTYLTSVHSRRLGLRVPTARIPTRNATTGERTIDLLTGSDELRQEMFWAVAHGLPPSTVPEYELPQPIPWREREPDETSDAADQPTIEPIASQIPDDCFYIRFGKYSNLLWLQHLLEQRAADLGRLVTLRSVNADYGQRLQSQLVVDKLPFAELIGDQVIADVALVGRDLFFREGAAVALVLQENAPLVASGLKKMRKKAAADNENVSLTTVSIVGSDVSFLSSPDNRIRSFYAARDKYHFITNSRTMMDRFLHVGQVIPSLAENSSFRQARRTMPLDREDTLFAFFSPSFFHGLLSPHYRIEMHRRIRARCELDVARLARHAFLGERAGQFFEMEELPGAVLPASGEEAVEPSLAQLSSSALLPSAFAKREDRSLPVWNGTDWVDSRRGASGSFLPIPDTAVTAASLKEISDFEQLAEYHAKHWDQFDPLVGGVQRARAKDDEQLERLTVDARLVTRGQSKYGALAKFLGPPTSQQLTCDAPLLASLQVSLVNRLRPLADPHFAFWGVLDQGAPQHQNSGGLLGALVMVRSAPAFLTVTGDALLSGRLLDRFRQFDQSGYFVGVTGLWRRKHEEFTSLSYHREVLEQVTPPMRFVDSNQPPVQARLHVGSLNESQLADWLASAAHDRSQQACLRNVRFMHSLTSQLGVEGAAARELAEQLVGAQLVCPLGGEYQWSADSHPGQWRSTAWPASGEFVSDDEETLPAVLKWCQGLDAELTQTATAVVLAAELLIRHEPDEPKYELSPFKLFSRPKKSPQDTAAAKNTHTAADQ